MPGMGRGAKARELPPSGNLASGGNGEAVWFQAVTGEAQRFFELIVGSLDKLDKEQHAFSTK